MTLSISIECSDPLRLVQRPLVSVLMITYNHADYLAQAINGVINQKCDFAFELIIGEDASTDATLLVALEYQRRYPEIIRVIHSDRNVGMNANAIRIFERARGDYIAYCEGDDFWCADDKLSRQVSAIAGRDDVGIVHADWTRARFKGGRWVYDLHSSAHQRVSDRYLRGNLLSTWYFPKILRTCTVLLRKQTVAALLNSGMVKREYRFGDSVLNLFVAAQWKVVYVPLVAAVYRVSPNSALRSGAKARVRFYESCLQFDTDAHAYFGWQLERHGGYRWESAVGLLVWAVRAQDWVAAKKALNEFRSHFTFSSFLALGCKSVRMRLPTFRRQLRDIPVVNNDQEAAAAAE
ncbi:MAG: hypothetical protein RSP_22760 [Rhodanobacter sp.]